MIPEPIQKSNMRFTDKKLHSAACAPGANDAQLPLPILESLYNDQIPPTATNLKCRWQEVVGEYEKTYGKCSFAKKITAQSLLRMYAGQAATFVIVDEHDSSADGKRASLLNHLAANPGEPVSPEFIRQEAGANVKLRSEPEVFLAGFRIVPKWFQGFVDPLGPDVYPEEMWIQLAAYLQTLTYQNEDNGWFQGGRYGAAKELRLRELPFLKERSLGELSHIVQLALTNEQGGGRGLLSYRPDKTIAPRSLSDRHRLADLGLPAGEQSQRCVGQDCASDEERWTELRHVLYTVLAPHPEGRSLALLKSDIERQFGIILDQSVFHEVKLINVFESPELKDAFEVRRSAQSGCRSQFIVHLKESSSMQAPPGLDPLLARSAVIVPPPVHSQTEAPHNRWNQGPTLLQASKNVKSNRDYNLKSGPSGQEDEKENVRFGELKPEGYNLWGLEHEGTSAYAHLVMTSGANATTAVEGKDKYSMIDSGSAGVSGYRQALRARGACVHRALQAEVDTASSFQLGVRNDPRWEPAKITFEPSFYGVGGGPAPPPGLAPLSEDEDSESGCPPGFTFAKGFTLQL